MKKVHLLLICLLISLLVFACNLSQPDLDATATKIAADIFATQTASVPTLTPTPVAIRLEADGSGDYRTLEEAVAAASPGETILLETGTYRLVEPLEVSKPLRLVGAGMDDTEIVSEAWGYVVRFSGDGPFAAECITFRYEGGGVADVAVVEGGEVAFARCRFTGARAIHAALLGGRAGLRLQGNTIGVVRDCVAAGNDYGIYVGGQAQPTLDRNVCTDNETSGIFYLGSPGGVACQNECSGNGVAGIYVGGQAQPTLEGNTCTGNKSSGIAYGGDASGVSRQNECAGNGIGIFVGEQSRPTLEGNVCADNERAGIAYCLLPCDAGGIARQNKCSGNEVGIYVAETAGPDLVDNDCYDNAEEDILDERP